MILPLFPFCFHFFFFFRSKFKKNEDEGKEKKRKGEGKKKGEELRLGFWLGTVDEEDEGIFACYIKF